MLKTSSVLEKYCLYIFESSHCTQVSGPW